MILLNRSLLTGRKFTYNAEAVLLFCAVTTLFAYGFYTFIRVQAPDDLGLHISYAEQIRTIADITSPHFLFQLLLKVWHAAGATYESGAVWVLGLCYGGMALLIAREIKRRGTTLTGVRAFIVIPALLLASHIFLPTMLRPNLYFGYFVPIAWHNPTQQLNKLFTLWIYFLYASEFLDAARARVSRVVLIGGLCILSAIAKPSFLIAFLPTAGLFAAGHMVGRRWRQVVLFAFGIALPAAAALLWQASVAFGAGTSASVVFAPFVVFDLRATLYKLPASLAFPLVVWIAARRTGVDDAKLHFVWVFTAIALFVTLCLGEGGPTLMFGNFAWTGQTAVFLAYVESLLLLISRQGLTRWRRSAWAVFAVHVACGLIWFGALFFRDRESWL
jgi:hypothetical protein